MQRKPGTSLLSHLYIEDTWLGRPPKFKGFPYTKGGHAGIEKKCEHLRRNSKNGTLSNDQNFGHFGKCPKQWALGFPGTWKNGVERRTIATAAVLCDLQVGSDQNPCAPSSWPVAASWNSEKWFIEPRRVPISWALECPWPRAPFQRVGFANNHSNSKKQLPSTGTSQRTIEDGATCAAAKAVACCSWCYHNVNTNESLQRYQDVPRAWHSQAQDSPWATDELWTR